MNPAAQIWLESQERAREIRPHAYMIQAARFFLAQVPPNEPKASDGRHQHYATLVFAIFALEGFLNFLAKRLKKPPAFIKKSPRTKLDTLLTETGLSSALKPERDLIIAAILCRHDLAHPKYVPLRRWVGHKKIRAINDTAGVSVLTPLEFLMTRTERFCTPQKLKKLVAAVEKVCAAMYKKTGGDPGPLNMPWDWPGWTSSGVGG